MHRDHYTVAILCALPVEMTAVCAMFTESHDDLPSVPTDTNTYSVGRIGQHNTVITCLPAGIMGNNSASMVANNLHRSFPKISLYLMVGIAGGIPSEQHDVRLGDVVVSKPSGRYGGVIQYDFGKTVQGGEFTLVGHTNHPPTALLNGVAKLQSIHMRRGQNLVNNIAEALQNNPLMRLQFSSPGSEKDVLFESSYDHPRNEPTCQRCDFSWRKKRPHRDGQEPVIHYGLVASGNQVIKHGPKRDEIGRDLDALCVEMEAAGLMELPVLVIRGICDYADSHKNKEWQPYAALVASAYAKELLQVLPAAESINARPILPPRSAFDSITDGDLSSHSQRTPSPGQNQISHQQYLPAPSRTHAKYQDIANSNSAPTALPPNPQPEQSNAQNGSSRGRSFRQSIKDLFFYPDDEVQGAQSTSRRGNRPPGEHVGNHSTITNQNGELQVEFPSRGPGTYIVTVSRYLRPGHRERVGVNERAILDAFHNKVSVRSNMFGRVQTQGRPYSNTIVWRVAPGRNYEGFRLVAQTQLSDMRINLAIFYNPAGAILPQGPGWLAPII